MKFGEILGNILIKTVHGIGHCLEYVREEQEKTSLAMERIQNKSSNELQSILNDKNADYHKRLAAQKILYQENIQSESNNIEKSIKKENVKSSKNGNRTTPAFREGNKKSNKTVIVLSAPGQAEKKARRPAAGQTGKTLQKAVEKLNKKCPDEFAYKMLDDYTIINASEKVEYKKKTGRTESSNNEIKSKENIKRIDSVLSKADTVMALGNKAKMAVSETKFKGNIIEGEHPSMQALNRKYKSDKTSSKERSDDRTGQWVEDLACKKAKKK